MKSLAYILAALLVVLVPAYGANYYVNDASTNGDVYCTATGSVANSGLTPSSPKASIQAVIDIRHPGAGDTIWVDTGTYFPTSSVGPVVNIVSFLTGSESAYLTIQGSTNWDAGGTTLKRADALYPVINIASSTWVAVKSVKLLEGQAGIYFWRSGDLLLEDARLWSSYGCGLNIVEGGPVIVRHTSFLANTGAGLNLYGTDARALIDHCTFWNNGLGGASFKQQIEVANVNTFLSISNSILLADGDKHCCVHFTDGEHRTYWGDYNDFYARNGGYIANSGYSEYTTLESWQGLTTGDVHSISLDPQMTGDGHLMSRAPGGTWWYGTWTNFDVNSPCIDAACSTSPYSNEPAPNGGRANLGSDGNTYQASKTADSDGDGLSDVLEEFTYGTNPDKKDSDDDGYNDFSELIAGTGATNSASFFGMLGIPATNQPGFSMTWFGNSGRNYQPQWRTNIVSGIWSNCTGLIKPSGQAIGSLAGTNGWVTAVDTNVNGKTLRFYRIRVARP